MKVSMLMNAGIQAVILSWPALWRAPKYRVGEAHDLFLKVLGFEIAWHAMWQKLC